MHVLVQRRVSGVADVTRLRAALRALRRRFSAFLCNCDECAAEWDNQ